MCDGEVREGLVAREYAEGTHKNKSQKRVRVCVCVCVNVWEREKVMIKVQQHPDFFQLRLRSYRVMPSGPVILPTLFSLSRGLSYQIQQSRLLI